MSAAKKKENEPEVPVKSKISLPYFASYGSIERILNQIRKASTPERFTHDFLKNKLGIKGGTYSAFVPLLKKIGLLGTDGTPTELYTPVQ